MTLDDLKAQRHAIPDDSQLPVSTTREAQAALQERRVSLDRRIRTAASAIETLAREAPEPDDARWRDELTLWRQTLADELLALPSRDLNPHAAGMRANLTLSLRAIDAGEGVLANTGYGLTTIRLGHLMRESGYEITGADPQRGYLGTMPWHGSLPEVTARIERRAARCAQAQASLDEALMDDDVRAEREAESQARRDVLNAMHIRNNAVGVVTAYDNNGEAIPVEHLTPLQREALASLR